MATLCNGNCNVYLAVMFTNSLLQIIIPLSKTVVITADKSTKLHFGQKLVPSDRTVQVVVRILLPWSDAPAVSYYGLFLSGSETSSTVQDNFTKLQLAHVQRMMRKNASTWLCDAHASFIGRIIGRIC